MNRLVQAAATLLEPPERDAVLGDLEEAGESGLRALGGVLGLAARRQAAPFRNGRPWLGLLALAIPLGMLLCQAARRVADSSAIHLWLYANNWSWGTLYTAGARRELAHQAGIIAMQYLTLAVWASVAGLALALVSRRSLAINGAVFGLLLFFGPVSSASTARYFPANAAVFEGAFYRFVFPALVEATLVMLPAIGGMQLAARWRQECKT